MKLQGLDGSAVWDNELKGRLLVVDDDVFLRTTLKEQFEAEGCDQIFEAGSLV